MTDKTEPITDEDLDVVEALKRSKTASKIDVAFTVSTHVASMITRIRTDAAEIKELRKVATDRSYRITALTNMLGPVGLEVVRGWDKDRVQRMHVDWGPKAKGLTGEERAQVILDFKDASDVLKGDQS